MTFQPIAKHDTVTYREPGGAKNSAVVTGDGTDDGRRVLFLDNNHWCYADDVIKVVSGPQLLPISESVIRKAQAGDCGRPRKKKGK